MAVAEAHTTGESPGAAERGGAVMPLPAVLEVPDRLAVKGLSVGAMPVIEIADRLPGPGWGRRVRLNGRGRRVRLRKWDERGMRASGPRIVPLRMNR